jgi:superoxide dismutase, Cu-Zn family
MSRVRMGGRLAAAALATAVVAAAVATTAPAVGGGTDAADAVAPGVASARMHDAQGNFLGKVWLLPRPGGKVAVRAATSFLPAGFHGFHIHAIGKCEAPFTSAGGHYNPGSAGHGAHAGDMPVLFVARDGNAWTEFQSDAFTIDELLDADGSAVIIHAGPDNHANIPTRYSATGPDATTLATGDAGARIACGVIERS